MDDCNTPPGACEPLQRVRITYLADTEALLEILGEIARRWVDGRTHPTVRLAVGCIHNLGEIESMFQT